MLYTLQYSLYNTSALLYTVYTVQYSLLHNRYQSYTTGLYYSGRASCETLTCRYCFHLNACLHAELSQHLHMRPQMVSASHTFFLLVIYFISFHLTILRRPSPLLTRVIFHTTFGQLHPSPSLVYASLTLPKPPLLFPKDTSPLPTHAMTTDTRRNYCTPVARCCASRPALTSRHVSYSRHHCRSAAAASRPFIAILTAYYCILHIYPLCFIKFAASIFFSPLSPVPF